jgi:hypothetical protein
MTEAIQLAERAGLVLIGRLNSQPVYSCTEPQVETLVRLATRQGRAEAMQLLRAEMNNPLNGAPARSVAHGVFGALKKRNDAFDAELAATKAVAEPCDYCGPGKRTGLPSNACENCLNTGLKNPTAENLR